MRLRNLTVVGVLALFLSACNRTTTTAPPSNDPVGTPSDGDLNVSASVKNLAEHEKNLASVGRKQGDSESNASGAVKNLAEHEENVALARVKRMEVVTPQGQRVQVAAEHDPWADAVVSYKPGKPAPLGHKDPRAAIGKPDDKGANVPVDQRKYVALGHGGVLVLEFRDNVLVDGPQDDLVVFEIGPLVEPFSMAISEDGKVWIDVGQAMGGKSSVDVGPFVKPGQRFRFVKVTDAQAGRSNNSKWAGADIEAVGALNSLPRH